jgi:hypothetical protein
MRRAGQLSGGASDIDGQQVGLKMSISIRYLKNGRCVDQEPWSGTLHTAEEYAKDQLFLKKAAGKADRVEVHDSDGKILFYYYKHLP